MNIILKAEFLEIIKEFKPRTQNQINRNIYLFSQDKELEPIKDTLASLYFTLHILPFLNRCKENYHKKSMAGKIGGKASKKQNRSNSTKSKQIGAILEKNIHFNEIKEKIYKDKTL